MHDAAGKNTIIFPAVEPNIQPEASGRQTESRKPPTTYYYPFSKRWTSNELLPVRSQSVSREITALLPGTYTLQIQFCVNIGAAWL